MHQSAVLFDIDGTLVDSNYLHIDAWASAFRELHLAVDAWRIHRAIGADADILLQELIGRESDGVQAHAKQLHSNYYRRLIPHLRLLPGARDLIAATARHGIRVVLATSAPAEELAALKAVLGMEHCIFAVTSGEDVEQAKPNPELVSIACERADVRAERAIMIGDSVWDLKAAAAAGVRSIGLLSGGTGAAELLEAGAIAVYADAAALYDQFSLSALSRLAH